MAEDNRYLSLSDLGLTTVRTGVQTATANSLVSTDGTGTIPLVLLPAGIGVDTKTFEASEDLTAGDFVNIYLLSPGNERVRKADANNARPAHGFVLSGILTGASGTVYLRGENTVVAAAIGTQYFLGASGAAVAAPTLTAGFIVQTLGYGTAESAGILYEFNEPATIISV